MQRNARGESCASVEMIDDNQSAFHCGHLEGILNRVYEEKFGTTLTGTASSRRVNSVKGTVQSRMCVVTRKAL